MKGICMLNKIEQGILDCLRRLATDDSVTVSLLDLAIESGRSLPTVQKVVQRLEADLYLRRSQQGKRSPTRYDLLSHEQRLDIALTALREKYQVARPS